MSLWTNLYGTQVQTDEYSYRDVGTQEWAALIPRHPLYPPQFQHIQPRSETITVSRYKCVVCLEDDADVLCVPTIRCRHVRCICSSCRVSYLNNAVCVQGLTRVSCPETGCREHFTESEIERWGNSQTGSRLKYLTGIRQETEDRIRRIQARALTPQPVPRDKRSDERASREYLRTNTKPCPKCHAPIVKWGDGCDHMKCAPPGGCGFEFCWLCLCDFEPVRQDGNHRHESSCKHYRPYC